MNILSITAALCVILVESFSGNVAVKPRGANQWAVPVKQQTLNTSDSLRIIDGAKLTIVDDETGRVYTFQAPAIGSVNQCLNKAKSSVNMTLRSMAYHMRNNAMGQNRQAQFRDIYGGTMRSMDPILLEIYNKKIACDLLSAAKQDKAMMPDVQLRTIENDGLITFAIDNNSKDSCYVNVLAVNDALGTVSLCIVPTPDMEENILLLPPAQTMDLYMFQFVKQPETRYLLVSLPISYTPSQIQALLRHPEDLECKTK